MTIQGQIEQIEILRARIDQKTNECKKRLEDEKIFDTSTDRVLYYALSQEDQDERNIEYYIDVYSRHGNLYEGSVYALNSHGEITVYINEIDETWTVNTSDLNVSNYFTILQILKHSWKLVS